MPLVIAHRGASAVELENSLAAFRRAVVLGADAIELDVHSTADGTIVVHHDPTVGGRRFAEATRAQATEHRLSNGERLPTLAESLAAIGANTTVFIETKTLDPRFDGHLLAAIDESPAPARCHVHAFDHRIIKRLCDRRPEQPSGVLSTSYLINPVDQIRAAGANALWQVRAQIDQALVDVVHAVGAKLYAWTVDDPAEMRILLDLGIDGLCTNTPDVARSVVG